VYLQLSLRDRMGRVLTSEVQPSDQLFTFSNMAPLVLTGEDLRPYLEQMAAAAGEMGGQGGGVLAEGQVSLCVQFFDGRSFTDPLTERICGSNFVELLEPPVPFCRRASRLRRPSRRSTSTGWTITWRPAWSTTKSGFGSCPTCGRTTRTS
jgi:hypothetical protein